MKSPTEKKPKGWMAGRFVWICLAVSLALNLMFVGGAFYAGTMAERVTKQPQVRTQHFVKRLKLRPEQRRAYEDFRAQAREHAGDLRANLRPTFEEMRSQLGSSNPNPEQLATALGEMADKRHAFERNMAGLTAEFLQTLNPNQTRQFLNFARRKSWQSTLGLPPIRRPGPGGKRSGKRGDKRGDKRR